MITVFRIKNHVSECYVSGSWDEIADAISFFTKWDYSTAFYTIETVNEEENPAFAEPIVGKL